MPHGYFQFRVTGPGLGSMPPMTKRINSSRPARMLSDTIRRDRGIPPPGLAPPGMGRHFADRLAEPDRIKFPILALQASTLMPITTNGFQSV